MTAPVREVCSWCGSRVATWEALRTTDDGPLETARRSACPDHLDAFVGFLRDVGRENYQLTRLCRPDPRRPR